LARYAFFTLFFASIALNLSWLFVANYDWRVIPAMLIAWYAVDAVSGIVHMYMDYKPCQKNKGLDLLFFYNGSRASPEYAQLKKQVFSKISFFEKIVFDFKTHHPRPKALARRSFTDQMRALAVFTLPLSVLLNVLCYFWLPAGWLLMSMNIFLVGLILTQYFHGTLHRDDNPLLIRLMRSTHLLMKPAQHDFHHATLSQDFATVSGWSNPVLNAWFNYVSRRGGFDPAGLEPKE
jgi:hypothetical protein